MTEQARPQGVPQGVTVRPLGGEDITRVLNEVLGERRRCTMLDSLDPGATQWVLAEFGDGRLTGVCREGEDQWEWAFVGGNPPMGGGPPTRAGDAWRLLELAVFTERAQVRVGEHAEYAHTAVDVETPSEKYLRPSTRHLLLLGWRKDRDDAAEQAGRAREYILPTGPNGGLVRTKELSGSEAIHPLTVGEWTDFDTKAEKVNGADTSVPVGSWLRVREYWAQDPDTGAVHVAYHRLAGYVTGPVTEEEEKR